MGLFLSLILVYFIGSVPFGYIVVKVLKNVDIRTKGSGNIGATNVTRVAGRKPGVLVFVLDFLKGFTAPFLIGFFVPYPPSPLEYMLVCFSAVAGHNWPVFLNFKGGKGVATSLGAVLGLCFKYPLLIIPVLSSLVIWIFIFYFLKYVSIASLSAAIGFFVITVFIKVPMQMKVFSFLLTAFIIIRHKRNIKNIRAKKELKF